MYIGAIYLLTPAQGSSGQVITVRIPVSSPARFRTTSVHRAFFKPMTPPPGVAYGAPGVSFFGYPTAFQRVDDFTGTVAVPPMGTNPLLQMAPGLHQLVITTAWDWAESNTLFQAMQAGASGYAASIPLPSFAATAAALHLPAVLPLATPATPAAPISYPIPPSFYIPMPAVSPTATISASTIPSSSSPSPSPSPTVSPQPPPEPGGLTVRWLSETFTPLRDGPGPVMLKPKNVPGIKKPIPVEDSSPPVRQFDFIVSAQLREGDETPVPDKRVTWQLLSETDLPGDDTELLEVSAKFLPLKRKLRNDLSPSYSLEARTDAEGKTYCWIRLRLFDRRQITNPQLYLRGFKIIIGDPEEPDPTPPVTASLLSPPVTVSASMAGTGMGPLFAAVGTGPNPPNQPWWQQLVDVLVEPFEQAATTGVHWVSERVGEAVAALPRTWQEVLGFGLKRFADGYLLMIGLYPVALLAGALEQARAATIGAFLGLPRGIWVMARDQVQDIKALVFDLPRAVFNFIAEDPKFALEVLATISTPALGQVIYHLDPSFQQKINESLSRFANLAAELPGQIRQLWQALTAMPLGDLIESVGGAIYSGFKDFVGDIATDYLRFPKDGLLFHFFVGGFMAGDFLGYILGTIGVQALAAYLSAGIATWVSGVAKIARAQRLLGAVMGVVDKMVEVFRQIQAALQGLGTAIKAGIGRVLLAFARFFELLDDTFIDPVVAAFHGQAQKMIRWLHRCFDLGEPDQLGACARALREKLLTRAGDARRVLELLAGFAERSFVAGC